MKKIFLILFLSCGFFVGSKLAKPFFQSAKEDKLVEKERKIPLKSEDQKPFVVFIYSKGGESSLKALRSAVQQDYKNFRIIFFEEGITNDEISKYLEDHPKGHLVERLYTGSALSENEAMQKAGIGPDEIVISLPSQNWLAHYHCLQVLNAYFSDRGIHCIEAASLWYPKYDASSKRLRIAKMQNQAEEGRIIPEVLQICPLQEDE